MSAIRRFTAQRRLTRLRGWLVPWALALLVAAQSLALLHGVLHHARAHHGDEAPHVSVFEDLFAGHSDTDCRVFDQHTPTDLASVPVLALSFAHAPAVPADEAAAEPLAARLRAFRARDPPTLA